MMFLLLRIVFWCAVSYVSCSISRYADGYNSTIERPLQPASGTVGFLHCSGWKSRRRPTPIGRALERALLPDGHPLSTVQASHVRLIYSLAKRIQNTKGGGDWDTWTETSPFGSPLSGICSTARILQLRSQHIAWGKCETNVLQPSRTRAAPPSPQRATL